MDQKKSRAKIIVDVRLHFQGRVYSLRIGRFLKWFLPILVIVWRVALHLREIVP